jgi:hypothetical protein
VHHKASGQVATPSHGNSVALSWGNRSGCNLQTGNVMLLTSVLILRGQAAARPWCYLCDNCNEITLLVCARNTMNREILAFYRHQLVAQFVSFSYFSLTTDASRTS